MKTCCKCKEVKSKGEFYFRNKKKEKLESQCKECRRKSTYDRYWSKKGKWIYIIKVDGLIIYIGSTTHLSSRLYAHKQHKRKGGFIFEAKKAGIDFSISKVELYVCNLNDMGLNMDQSDLRFYEHSLIKYFLEKKEPLLNIKKHSKFNIRDRYIDEMPIDSLLFKKHSFIDSF